MAGPLKLPPGATLVDNNASSSMALPPGATLVDQGQQQTAAPPAPQQPPQKGILGRAWDAINKPIMSGDALSDGMRSTLSDFATRPPTEWDANHPILSGAAKGYAGAERDAIDTASSFTSPLSIGMVGLGALGKVLPAGGRIAQALRALQGGTGAVIAGKGAMDVKDAVQNPNNLSTPDRLQQGLTGAAAVSGGSAAAADIVPSPRGMLSKNMAKVPTGEQFSPGEVNQAARDNGVKLDLADATGNKVAKVAKAVTQHGIGGSGTFDAASEHNNAALNQWGTQYLDGLSPNSGEAAGSRVVEALKTDMANRKGQASGEFRDLDQRVGQNTIDGTQTVEAQARAIVNEMDPYYSKHPNLMPKQAYSIVKNLAERPKVPDGNGGMVAAPAHQFSWSELHKLRSDLMDVYRNNTDLTKGQSDAWLQGMVKTIDDTMTNSANGLSPADQAQFRHANDIWEGMKSTYDNPQHPFYHAVRAQFDSAAPQMMAQKAPELAREINNTLGPNAGDFQRSVVEKLLGRTPDGAGYDFKGIAGRLKQYSPDYLNQLLGRGAADELYKLARVGRTVTNDINPSGSGKLLQKAGEAGAIGSTVMSAAGGHVLPLVGAAAVPAVEYGIAKGMNSPKVVDYLTKPNPKPRPQGRVTRGAIAGAVASGQSRR